MDRDTHESFTALFIVSNASKKKLRICPDYILLPLQQTKSPVSFPLEDKHVVYVHYVIRKTHDSTHRKNAPRCGADFNVPRQNYFETNSRRQKRYSEDGTQKFRGCRGLLGRVESLEQKLSRMLTILVASILRQKKIENAAFFHLFIDVFIKGRKSSNFVTILMKRTRLLNLKRHVSATPVPSSVYG